MIDVMSGLLTEEIREFHIHIMSRNVQLLEAICVNDRLH
jgi:hypothetical protein